MDGAGSGAELPRSPSGANDEWPAGDDQEDGSVSAGPEAEGAEELDRFERLSSIRRALSRFGSRREREREHDRFAGRTALHLAAQLAMPACIEVRQHFGSGVPVLIALQAHAEEAIPC